MRRSLFRVKNTRLLIGGVGAALFLMGLSPAGASSANISHSYSSSTTIPNGSLVSLDPTRSNYVVLSNTENGTQLLGIAVASDDSLIAVDSGDGQVQVATSGTASTLVSTIDGTINVGDQVSVSPFNGLGMKSAPGAHVIGLAQTSFNNKTAGITTQTVTDKSGNATKIDVGYIKLGIAIGTASTQGSDDQLNGLEKLSKSITGHTVSSIRVLISLIIAVVAFLALVTLIYASIYGSIISIGRNPLAKYAVFRTLSSVLGMVILTALIATITIFFLLR
jgi:hypothetical protein